jgi:hypothetical protein
VRTPEAEGSKREVAELPPAFLCSWIATPLSAYSRGAALLSRLVPGDTTQEERTYSVPHPYHGSFTNTPQPITDRAPFGSVVPDVLGWTQCHGSILHVRDVVRSAEATPRIHWEKDRGDIRSTRLRVIAGHGLLYCTPILSELRLR